MSLLRHVLFEKEIRKKERKKDYAKEVTPASVN